ncbi:hypothetical protein AQUCO_04300028v1 [Aquilegia coerulea]|uniref:Ubiquitin thioesterase n=1 Tax=Aquilegia coerulea TaxID=218851 RepID=A0A2G5CPR1_AQUCA|nr:hypothetical protein AQUCO_04300028v1 [Aquilegia coerulea]
MGNNEKVAVAEEEKKSVNEVVEVAIETSYVDNDDWATYRDDEVMQQHNAIQAEEAHKLPFVGDKEPLSALAAEYQSGSPIIQEKIKLLGQSFSAIRRTRGDGNCFFRCFMFAYLLFLEQLESVMQGNETSISHDELLTRSRDQSVSDYVVMFFRFVTSGEVRRRAEFFEPFILGLSNMTVEKFCKASVEPMGEESDHVHITALSDALGVAIRVMYLDRSSCDTGSVSVNHHDFVPSISDSPNGTTNAVAAKPVMTLLYRPGHYDILYSK